MKIRNLRLASLLVAMVMGAQGVFAQDVTQYSVTDLDNPSNSLQYAIENYTEQITLKYDITQDTTTALYEFTGTKELNGDNHTLSGMGTNTYTGIINAASGNLTINNITLNNFSTAVTNNGTTLTINDSTISNSTTAISNTAGTLNLNSVTVENTNTDGLNLTGGTTNLTGTDDINSSVTLSGNSTRLVNQGTTTISGDISSTSGTPTIENQETLTLSGNNTNYSGDFTQSTAGAETTVTGTFFGGTSTISDGTLNWDTTNAIPDAAKLAISGNSTILNINSGTLDIKNTGSSIGEGVTAKITGNLNVGANGSANLTKGNWNGTINLSSATGTLTLNGITQGTTGILNATEGNLNLSSGTTSIGTNGQIASNVKTNLESVATIDIKTGGQVALNANDTWSGSVLVNGGSLTVDGRTSNGILKADTGSVTLTDGTLEIGKNTTTSSYIKSAVTTAINGGTLKITDGGEVTLDNTDVWKGTVNITSGTLNLNNVINDATNNGKLNATGGNVSLTSTTLNISDTNSQIGENVTLNFDNNSIINVSASSVTLNGGATNADTWYGTVNLSDGTLTAKNISNTGALNATGGTLDIQGTSAIKTAQVAETVTTKIASGTTLEVIAGTDKTVTLNNNDTWNGTVHVNGGDLILNNATNNGVLNAESGKVNLSAGTLAIGTKTEGTSIIAKEVQTTIGAGTNLNISDGGEVTLDGATNDSWATTGTVNISNGGKLAVNNITNGKLVATGGNIDIEKGTLIIAGDSSVSDTVVNISGTDAVFNLQKDHTVSTISGSGTLDIDGKTLKFTDASNLDNGINFKSKNNASVIIENSTKANDVLGVITNATKSDNSGLNIELNGSDSNTALTIDGSKIAKLTLKGTETFAGALTINDTGEVSNNGTLTLTGAVSSNGTSSTFSNTGTITATDTNLSSFTGTYNQTAGSLTVGKDGKVFGGQKNISGSTLNVTADSVYYNSVKLGNGGKLSHTGTGSATVSDIKSDVVDFVTDGTGATATFTNGKYNLSKIDNGKANTIAITGGSTITLENTDYKGGTIYDFTGSKLDLLEKDAAATANNYEFTEIKTGNNTTLNFNVVITPNGDNDGGRKLVTDTITVTKSGAVFKFGYIYISGEENGKRGQYLTTDKNILTGATFATTPSDPTIVGATTTWLYKVKANGNNSIALEIDNYADNHTLYEMNNTEDVRFFQFTKGDDREYIVDGSLGETKEGRFNITGDGKGLSTISGGNSYSLFDIKADKEVALNIDNVTIKNAKKTGNGSVIANESADAVINVKNTSIESNNATGNGGAIYNAIAPTDTETNNLKILGTDFKDNSAGGKGGAIYNAGNADISSTVFTGNSGANGGAIYNEGKMVINGVENITTFTGNSATGNGGAIYNKGDLTLNNITIAAASETAKNDIYQEDGSTTLTGKNAILSDITAASGTIKNKGTTRISGKISGQSAITNESSLTLTGDNSGHTGTFTQTAGTTTIEGTKDNTGKFFAGKSTISNGTLNWFTENDIATGAKLTVTVAEAEEGQTPASTNLIIGKDATQEAVLSIGNVSSITEDVAVTLNAKSKLNIIDKGTVELNDNDTWNGDITITGGQLDVNNINKNGKLIAQDGGTINLNSGYLDIVKDSIIAANNDAGNSTALKIAKGATLRINGGKVTMNDNDDWKGIINLKSGTLNIEESTDGILHADGGNLSFSTGKLTIENGSYIKLDTVINLPGPSDPAEPDFPNGSILEIKKGGEVAVNDNDIWNGEILLNGGELNYGVTKDKTVTGQTGTLTANIGNLNLLDGSILNIQVPSQVQDEVEVDIRNGALVELNEDAEFRLDSKDQWSGMISNSGGILTTTGLKNNTDNGGGLQQTSGSSTFQDDSHISITDEGSYIIGGDLNILNNSSLFLGGATEELKVDNLTMSENSLLNMRNYKINRSVTDNMLIDGNNKFSIEISPRDWKNDKFIIDTLKSANADEDGNIHISDFNFLGLCPIDRHITLRIFDAKSIQNITFDTTDKEIFTPIGWYDLKSIGGGYFTSNLTRYNPQVFRGQVATLAAYNNQLAIDDMILNHVTLQSERFLAQGKNANRYAINASQFAPYQYRKEDGGLWFKNYVNFETLTMTQNLNVHNTAYGSIIGADLPVKNLKDGWEFMPTAYVGYTGAQQSYSNMHMYQNGGQAGFMGTFMKNDFVGSVLAYGGAYYNEMQVAGFKDETMNWFLGTAAKAAYNIHASKHFTVQPTAFLSYNFFGKQNWGTDFGIMSMNSGMMNGVSVAPGVNFIYARESWNIYATVQYMYNINEGISGNAGNVQLHDIRMRHGYMQYGIGATKTWKDRFNSYVQLVFRNGGRTGIGVQLGAQYLFDWSRPSTKKQKQNKTPKQKSTIKTL